MHIATLHTLISACCLIFFLSLTQVNAQDDKAGTTQPNFVDFGAVCQDGIAEGSVRFFVENQRLSGLSSVVFPPDFLSVKRADLSKQAFGNRGEYVVFDTVISVDTGTVGDFESTYFVKVGDAKVSIPVRVQVVPKDELPIRLLVVQSPFEKYSTSNGSLFENWLEIVRTAKVGVSYLLAEPGQDFAQGLALSDFDVILLGETALFADQKSFQSIEQFVEEGGHLVIAANEFFADSVDNANRLLKLAGMQIQERETTGEVGKDGLAEDPLLTGIEKLKFRRCSPTEILDESKAKILVATPGEPGYGCVAIGNYGKGTITSLGQSLWWNWVSRTTPDDKPSDNGVLLRNLIARPAAAGKGDK